MGTGFQNDSFFTPNDHAVTHEEIQRIQEQQAIEQAMEQAMEQGQGREFGLPSDVMDRLREVEAESADLSPTALKMKELQERDSHGIIDDVIDKIQEIAADVVETVKDIFDGPDDRAKFDQAEFRESIETAAKEWHEQTEDYSCAIACQQFIINEYTDAGVSEQELIDIARDQGWYQAEGTSYVDIGNLLNMYDIDTSVKMTGDFQDLLDATANGDRVIVGVQNIALVTEWCDGYPYGSANHAVEVLGIDRSDPENLKVIVNDPGVGDGRAKAVSYENFMDAWSTSGGYMLTAHKG